MNYCSPRRLVELSHVHLFALEPQTSIVSASFKHGIRIAGSISDDTFFQAILRFWVMEDQCLAHYFYSHRYRVRRLAFASSDQGMSTSTTQVNATRGDFRLTDPSMVADIASPVASSG